MSEAVWLELKDVERLGIPLRTIRRHCKAGKFTTKKVTGRGGSRYQVSLDSLPDDVKLNYADERLKNCESSEVLDINDFIESHPDPEIEAAIMASMTDYERKYIERFLILYKLTEGLKGSQLRFFLDNYNEKNPGYGWSYSAFQELKKTYKESGCSVSSIRPKWGANSGKSKIPTELRKKFYDDYLTMRKASARSCWKNVLGAARRLNPQLNAKEFPSHTAFLNILKKEIPKSVIDYKRLGPTKWRQKYGYNIDRNYDDLLCGEAWVSDHVQSDLAVETPDGKIHFLWITVWIDVKSQKWLGWDIHVEPPTSDHIFASFFAAAAVHGIPSDVIIDNGKDYRCKSLTGGRQIYKLNVDETECISLFGANGLNITVHFAWPYSPQSKICEQTFRKVNYSFSRHHPGYRGINSSQKPESLKEELSTGDIFKLEEFETAFNGFINTIYNLEPCDESKVLRGRCPNQLWDLEYPAATKELRVRIVTKDALMLFCSPLSKDKQIRNEIYEDSVYDLKYYAPWMLYENGTSVRIRRHPKDLGIAWFWDAKTNRYLGSAELDGNVPALVRTPIAKKNLDDKIRRKKQAERVIKNFIKTQTISNEEYMANRSAAVTAMNEARGYSPSSVDTANKAANIVITEMDRVIAEEARRKKAGQYDFTQFAEIKKKQESELDLWGEKAVNF